MDVVRRKKKGKSTQMTRIFRSMTVAALAVCFAGMLSGCNRGASDRAAAPTKVQIRLQWYPTAQFAGMYLAKAKGYYKERGLDVELLPGGPNINAVTLVGNGTEPFGIWTADAILAAQSKGMPITIVAAIFRKDPNVLIVKADSPIKSPKDFVGKTITTVRGRATETLLLALLDKEGISTRNVKIEPFPFTIQSFLDGKVDVSAAYVYDHVYQARKHGQQVRLFNYSDYGLNFYSDCLIVNNDYLKKFPDVVKAVVQGTIQGWTEALAHPEEAVDAMVAVDKGLDRDAQLFMIKESEPLIRPAGDTAIGVAHLGDIDKMADVLKKQGLLSGGFDSARSFDNSFIVAGSAK